MNINNIRYANDTAFLPCRNVEFQGTVDIVTEQINRALNMIGKIMKTMVINN